MAAKNIELIPQYADVMTVLDFNEQVKEGGFIRSDGDGYWADGTHMDRDANVWDTPQPKWATHVAWFNV